MQEPPDTRKSLDVVSFYSRIWLPIGLVFATLMIVAGILTYRDTSRLSPLLNVLSGLLLWVYCIWMGYCAWRNPILHLGPDEIRWCPPGTLHPQRMPVAQVTGFSWPAHQDLWIQGTGGKTLRIVVFGVRRVDRERARAWLSERWGDRGLAAPTR